MNELLLELQPYLIGAITVILGYVGKQIGIYFRTITTAKERDQALKVIKASVDFVEQVSGDNLLSEDKFALALEQAKRQLSKIGLDLEDDEIEMWIESFVKGLNE